MVDLDTHLVIVSLKKAQEIFNLEEQRVSGIGLRIEDPYQAREIKERVYKTIG